MRRVREGLGCAKAWRYAITASALAVLEACASGAPVPLARRVDVDQMYGAWHIIATIPNPVERGMVAPVDVYSKRPDGDIREDFYVRFGGFNAPEKHFVVHDWVRPRSDGAHWRVQLLWPFNFPFLILYVDPQYRYVVFGEQNRSMGWIYARSARLSDQDYEAALGHLAAAGYDPVRFRKIVQAPDEIGKPGYWSDGVR